MTRQHVLRTFRKAGFPLAQGKFGSNYRYISSVVEVLYAPSALGFPAVLRVHCRGGIGWTSFGSPSKALKFINARLSMTLVHRNDWALSGPSDKRPSLSLIVGGAA